MSVLNIANKILEFHYKFPWFIDDLMLWIFLYITALSILNLFSS